MSGRGSAILVLLTAVACTPPPVPSPSLPPPPPPGRAPVTPPGLEGLRAAPCSKRIDLAAMPAVVRAFAPGSLRGRVEVTPLLRGPAARLRWSSSRPEALRFDEGAAGVTAWIAGEPGLTLARLTAGDDAEEATALVSVPFFVSVRADADLAPLLAASFGLGGRERALAEEARRVLDAVYARVNVRFAFRFGLGEELPAELPEGGFVVATLHGDLHRCVTPQSNILYSEFGGYAEGDTTRRLVRAPVHLCPAIFARRPDTMAAIVKHRAELLADERAAALYTSLLGRAVGELLAHEIGHQLLGCDTRGERRTWRCHDRAAHSLMNKAGERSFTDRTGVTIRATAYTSHWRGDFPAPGTYEDGGVAAINRLSASDQAALEAILPAPPALGEEAPCR